jgi:hypothetical protein
VKRRIRARAGAGIPPERRDGAAQTSGRLLMTRRFRQTALIAAVLAVSALAAACLTALVALSSAAAEDQGENYENWRMLKSTFPSTGGGGIVIKGYDPVITGGKCVTTFMAVEPGANPNVYPNYIEFQAQPAQGGTLCVNGQWKSFDGATGTTPFRVFFKNGVFRASP